MTTQHGGHFHDLTSEPQYSGNAYALFSMATQYNTLKPRLPFSGPLMCLLARAETQRAASCLAKNTGTMFLTNTSKPGTAWYNFVRKARLRLPRRTWCEIRAAGSEVWLPSRNLTGKSLQGNYARLGKTIIQRAAGGDNTIRSPWIPCRRRATQEKNAWARSG